MPHDRFKNRPVGYRKLTFSVYQLLTHFNNMLVICTASNSRFIRRRKPPDDALALPCLLAPFDGQLSSWPKARPAFPEPLVEQCVAAECPAVARILRFCPLSLCQHGETGLRLDSVRRIVM